MLFQVKHPSTALSVKLALTPDSGLVGSNTCGWLSVISIPDGEDGLNRVDITSSSVCSVRKEICNCI